MLFSIVDQVSISETVAEKIEQAMTQELNKGKIEEIAEEDESELSHSSFHSPGDIEEISSELQLKDDEKYQGLISTPKESPNLVKSVAKTPAREIKVNQSVERLDNQASKESIIAKLKTPTGSGKNVTPLRRVHELSLNNKTHAPHYDVSESSTKKPKSDKFSEATLEDILNLNVNPPSQKRQKSPLSEFQELFHRLERSRSRGKTKSEAGNIVKTQHKVPNVKFSQLSVRTNKKPPKPLKQGTMPKTSVHSNEQGKMHKLTGGNGLTSKNPQFKMLCRPPRLTLKPGSGLNRSSHENTHTANTPPIRQLDKSSYSEQRIKSPID